MSSISTISISPDALNWLESSRQPRILHVFNQACNLINEYGEVFSIVKPQIGNGPFNLVVDADISFFEHLKASSAISIFAGQLELGDRIINTMRANLWNPRPDWKTLHARSDDIFNRLMSLSIPNYNLSIPNSLVSHFSNALANADISSAKSIAFKLAGLGIGLTPAGDDFIMGAIYALWIFQPPEVAKSLALEVTNTAVPLTTSLSAAWLKSAGRGEAGVLWHELFDAILTGEGMELSIAKLFSVGETSGADALAGFLSMFNATMKG